MSQLNRLHQGDITNGNLIDASQINAEFNQLVSESNTQDTRLNALETGNLTIGGVKTFTEGLRSPTIALTASPTVAGQIGAVNNNLMHHNGAGVATIETTLNQGFIILEDRKPAGNQRRYVYFRSQAHQGFKHRSYGYGQSLHACSQPVYPCRRDVSCVCRINSLYGGWSPMLGAQRDRWCGCCIGNVCI
jgi:hypothetical protein